MPTLRVHLLPQLLPAEPNLVESCCVVIDVLRASTTMVQALGAGAAGIRPFSTIAAARAFAVDTGYLLAGERGGVPIDGFDFGNSPREFSSQLVGGRHLAMTTTNGTQALVACQSARQVIVAAFTNLSAVCRFLACQSQVDIVCAGTDGEVTAEDVLLAGAIVARTQSAVTDNDSAVLSRHAWLRSQGNLADALLNSLGGQNLVKLGRQVDIKEAALLDRWQFIPMLIGDEVSRLV